MKTKTATPDYRAAASAHVAKHGKYVREGVYVVRWPLHAASGMMMAPCTSELADKVAARMRDAATKGDA